MEYPELEKAQQWFNEHLPELLETMKGEYVAVIDGEIVGHNPDLGELAMDVYSKYDQRPIFIDKVETPHTIMLPSVWISH